MPGSVLTLQVTLHRLLQIARLGIVYAGVAICAKWVMCWQAQLCLVACYRFVSAREGRAIEGNLYGSHHIFLRLLCEIG